MTSKKSVKWFIRAARSECIRGYTERESEIKARWLRIGGEILAELAGMVGYAPGEFDIRVNPGGPAVSGNVYMQTDRIFVALGQTVLGTDMGFMWRTCRNREDSEGLDNRWMPWETLAIPEKVAAAMRHAVHACQHGRGVLKRPGGP